jgi:hypothetical protein
MDRGLLLMRLTHAERHIVEAKALIERQREVVGELMQKGHNTEVASSTLSVMEDTLKRIETHRNVILHWVKLQKFKEERPPPLPSDQRPPHPLPRP